MGGVDPFGFCDGIHTDRWASRDAQSEDRKSFRPPFFVTWASSRMRILLRRWTTQFFDLEGVLEEDELEPEVLEEVEDLQGERERKKKKRFGSEFEDLDAKNPSS